MKDTCTYRIEILGCIDVDDLNTISPLKVMMARDKIDNERREALTQFTVYTDQSGLIGLIRCLHGRGIILMSVHREG